MIRGVLQRHNVPTRATNNRLIGLNIGIFTVQFFVYVGALVNADKI